MVENGKGEKRMRQYDAQRIVVCSPRRDESGKETKLYDVYLGDGPGRIAIGTVEKDIGFLVFEPREGTGAGESFSTEMREMKEKILKFFVAPEEVAFMKGQRMKEAAEARALWRRFLAQSSAAKERFLDKGEALRQEPAVAGEFAEGTAQK